jgi:hypothetical protein
MRGIDDDLSGHAIPGAMRITSALTIRERLKGRNASLAGWPNHAAICSAKVACFFAPPASFKNYKMFEDVDFPEYKR